MAEQAPRKPGKYLLIDVPRPEGDTTTSSFVLLGATPDPSQDPPPFVDDTRMRDGCPDFVPPGVRQAVTSLLYEKGGWLDYSDGNRITTTRGDKVEVIQGSLSVVVLGRQADRGSVDVSGGHVGEGGITFGGASATKWVQNYDGTWKITQTTTKGDVESTYVGDTVDQYYGLRKESTTGSETPLAPGGPVGAADAPYKYNPTMIDRTWAESIASYTGSAALPVPLIASTTWAKKMASKTRATSKTETTVVTDTIASATTVEELSDETTAKSITSVTHADVEDTTYGDSTSTTHGNTKSLNHGNDFTLVEGISTEVMILGSNEVTIGEEVSVTIGGVVDISLAAKLEIDLGASMSLNVGPKIDLLTSETKLVAAETNLAASKTEVSGVRSIVSGLIRML
jgi:hypothetical protein